MPRLSKVQWFKCIILGLKFNSEQCHQKLKQSFKTDRKFSGLIEFEPDLISFFTDRFNAISVGE